MQDNRWSPLRVGIVAPPWFPIPPEGYGGIERVVYWLAEGLLDRGHDVTVVASGPRGTSARFLQTYAEPPSDRCGESIPEVVHALAATEVLDDLDLDLVHDHSLAGPLTASRRRAPTVVTAHGPAEGELARYYAMLGHDVSMVAISEFQRASQTEVPWRGVVYNAIPVEEFPFEPDKDDFCLFLGRMSPEKGPSLAIEAARLAGYPIVVAGKCNEPAERRYFEQRVRPLLGPDADWFGQADTEQKKDLLARARCLVFPIQWNEPFGLVMVEAMACGTPVVALRAGAAPEVVEDGVTGFLCDRPSELPAAINQVDQLEPKACRLRVADHFDVHAMTEGYEAIYRQVLRAWAGGSLPAPPQAVSGQAGWTA